ncbi:MAG TPA: glycosyltransferase family 4 protein [Verrucomicrobiae bacterium]|nr:glycosyltransferase family 4 protein [Verrucomicrobiae bacterium]
METPFLNPPKRILMTADTIGGVWTYALELARALASHGVEVVMATMGARLNSGQASEASSIPNLEIFESDYKLEWMSNPWRDVSLAGDWLLGLESRFKPDVIHLNGYAHGALPWRAPVVVVGHSCVLSWWRAVKGENAPAGCRHYREAVMRGIQAADLVIAPSRAMLEALEYHYGPLRGTEVIYNSREPDWFKPGRKENFILAAGRLWDEAKNIAALAGVAAEVPWPVYVAGEERHPEAPAAISPGHIRLLGRLGREDLSSWFAKASIYAFPARYEPFGLSVLEAGLAGCALVLGDIPSLREIWGRAALYIPPEDGDVLRSALKGLISNPARLNQLAARARRRAMEFMPGKMAKRYLAAWAGLIRNPRFETKEQLACAS